MDERTKKELKIEVELMIRDAVKEVLEEVKKGYAVKLVERILFSLLGMSFIFFAGWYFSHLTSKSDLTTSNVQQIIPSNPLQ